MIPQRIRGYGICKKTQTVVPPAKPAHRPPNDAMIGHPVDPEIHFGTGVFIPQREGRRDPPPHSEPRLIGAAFAAENGYPLAHSIMHACISCSSICNKYVGRSWTCSVQRLLSRSASNKSSFSSVARNYTIMAPPADMSTDVAALARRKALTGASGPLALVKNRKVFGIACFACLGGYA